MEKWHELRELARTGDGAMTAEARIEADSPWFDGHFPNEPVLPGIAQLGMVWEIVRRALGGTATVIEVSRVRFRRIIPPGEPIRFSVERGEGRPDVFNFRILAEDEPVCTGFLKLKFGDGSKCEVQ